MSTAQLWAADGKFPHELLVWTCNHSKTAQKFSVRFFYFIFHDEYEIPLLHCGRISKELCNLNLLFLAISSSFSLLNISCYFRGQKKRKSIEFFFLSHNEVFTFFSRVIFAIDRTWVKFYIFFPLLVVYNMKIHNKLFFSLALKSIFELLKTLSKNTRRETNTP